MSEAGDRFDRLQEQADALIIKRRSLHPRSPEWRECEMQLLGIFIQQAGRA